MTSFQSTYTGHAFALWLVLLLLIIGIGVWTWRLHTYTRTVEARYEAIFSDVGDENTARMLAEYLSTVRRTAQSVSLMQEQHDRIAQVMPSAIRHVGLVRFSPFHDTGSDQSFAIALLDGRRDGVVITALHSRTDSRLYAKPVEGGSSTYSLTPEERQAMERAMSGNIAAPAPTP